MVRIAPTRYTLVFAAAASTTLLAGALGGPKARVAAGPVEPHRPDALFTVTASNDLDDGTCSAYPGHCSLREALLAANAASGADSVDFHPSVSGTILLATPLPHISGALTLTGPGAGALTVDANNLGTVLWVEPAVSATVSGLTLTRGIGQGAGGTAGGGVVNRGTLALRGMIIDGNSGQSGGGIFNDLGGDLDLRASTVRNNTAQSFGAAIYSVGGGTNVTISDSTFSGNVGGSNTINAPAGTTLDISNTTISGNTATQPGGVAGVWGGTNVNISFSTIVANSGIGLFSSWLRSSIVDSCGSGGGIVGSLGHNLAPSSACFLAPGTNDVYNPNFVIGPLQNNGGPVETHALLTGSPAIDAGDPNNCPATDARGFARPAGAACDIGAFEYRAVAPPSATPTQGPTATATPGCVLPPAGMAAWYPLNEPPGSTIVTDIWAANHGTPQPGPVGGAFLPTSGPVPGAVAPNVVPPAKVAGSLYFWDQQRLVVVPHSPSLDLGTTGSLSLDAWIYTATHVPGGTADFVSPVVDKFDTSGGVGYGLYVRHAISGADTLELVFGDGTTTTTVTSAPLVAQLTWVHVAATVEQLTGNQLDIRLYINGALQGSLLAPAPSAAIVSGQTLHIAGQRLVPAVLGPAGYTEVAIDELEIFRRALTPAEVAALYSAGSFGKCRDVPDVTPTPSPTRTPKWPWNVFLSAMLNGAVFNTGAATAVPTAMASNTPEGTATDAPPSPTPGASPTATFTQTSGQTGTPQGTATATQTAGSATATPTVGGLVSPTPTSPTFTATSTPTATSAGTGTSTSTATQAGPTHTPTPTVTSETATSTPSATPTATVTASTTFTPTSTPPCAPAPAFMEAWWALDELAGSVAFEGIGGHDGAIVGNTAPIPVGRVGPARTFDGASGMVVVPHSASLDPGSGDFSVDAWIRPDAGGLQPIVTKQYAPADAMLGYEFVLRDGHLSVAFADGTATITATAPVTIPLDGGWHFVALSLQRGSATGGKLYVAGVPVHTFDTTALTGTFGTTAELHIAEQPALGHGLAQRFFTGGIDEVEVFHAALSDADVLAIYSAGVFGKCGKPPTPTATATPTATRPSPTPTATLSIVPLATSPDAVASSGVTETRRSALDRWLERWLRAIGLSARHEARPAGSPGGVEASVPAQACDPQPVVPIGENFFVDISAQSGIQAENFIPSPATPVPANDHSRLAFVDLNRDGLDDIVTTNMTGNHLLKPFEHLIYLNRGDGTFENFSDASGLRTVQSAFLAFGDMDNDGDQDAFAGVDGAGEGPRGAPNQILLNDGTGRFTVKPNAGLGSVGPNGPLAGNAVLADFDADGNLDLFVGNGATSFAATDQLYLGRGDGTFTEASGRLQGAIQRPSNGSVACDYDNDRDLDIFVSNYGVSWQNGHDVLWENDGSGNFTNVARARGFEAMATGNYYLASTGYGRNPEPVAQAQFVGGNGFGLSCEDINNDGNMDIWLANISHPVDGDYRRKWSDPSLLLINQGPDAGFSFVNTYLDAKIPFNEGDLEGSVADFDNDGLVDLAMTREDKYERSFTNPEQKGWLGLFHQLADGTFETVGMRSGINNPSDTAVPPRLKAGHSNVWADIEKDGDLDLLVGGLDRGGGRPNFLLRNDIGSRNAWLAVTLQSDSPDFNRDAIGSRVELVYPDRVLARELKSSRGMYNSSDTRTLHFGLGNLGCATTVRVTWPNGETATYDGAELGQNQFVTLRYGDALATSTPVPTPGLPDLVLSDHWSDREPRGAPCWNPDDPHNPIMDVQVANVGTGPSGAFAVVAAGGPGLTWNVDGLAAGEARWLGVKQGWADVVIVDAEDQVVEADETNNRADFPPTPVATQPPLCRQDTVLYLPAATNRDVP